MRFLESERIEAISPALRRPRCWIRTARKMRFVVISQSDLGSPVLFAKIFRFTRRANHLYKFAPSHPTRGAYRDRHGRGVWMRWTRQRFACDGIAGRVERLLSGHRHADERCCSVRQNRVVLTPRCWCQVRGCFTRPNRAVTKRYPRTTVAKEPGHRGERDISR
jgi:hypothetical protein